MHHNIHWWKIKLRSFFETQATCPSKITHQHTDILDAQQEIAMRHQYMTSMQCNHLAFGTQRIHSAAINVYLAFISIMLLYWINIVLCYIVCHTIKTDLFWILSSVAWFTLDRELSNAGDSGMYFSQNDTVVTVDGWEHRVGLGSVGFSRGVHYWEFKIEKYVPDTDPAFGVARIDVARDKMLGKSHKTYTTYTYHTFILVLFIYLFARCKGKPCDMSCVFIWMVQQLT